MQCFFIYCSVTLCSRDFLPNSGISKCGEQDEVKLGSCISITIKG